MVCNMTKKENNCPFQFLIIAFIQHFIIMKRMSPPTGRSHLQSKGEGQGNKFNSLDIYQKKNPCSFAHTLNLNTEAIVPSIF